MRACSVICMTSLDRPYAGNTSGQGCATASLQDYRWRPGRNPPPCCDCTYGYSQPKKHSPDRRPGETTLVVSKRPYAFIRQLDWCRHFDKAVANPYLTHSD